MKFALTLIVGLHMLLGSIALAGLGVMEPLKEVNMTPLVTMSLATDDMQASAPECGAEEKTVVSTPGMKSTCPTAQCIAENDDAAHPTETSLVFGSPKETPPIALLTTMPFLSDREVLSVLRKEERPSTTLAFHLGNLILRE